MTDPKWKTKPLYKITKLWGPPEVGVPLCGRIYGHPNVKEGGRGVTSPVKTIHTESLVETENSVYIIEPEAATSDSEGPVPE